MPPITSLPATAAQRSRLQLGISKVPEALREGVLTNLQRFAEQLNQSTAIDVLPESSDAKRDWLTTLPHVWACSEFVSHACIRDVRLLPDLTESGDLQRAYQPGEVANRIGVIVDRSTDDENLATALRRSRRREMVRIAWRQLCGWGDLEELMSTTSELADAYVDGALQRHHAWLSEIHGYPQGQQSRQPVNLIVLGLGKLGGHELNFSSDIDLIFAYPEDGQTTGGRYSNLEFFTRLGQRLIRCLDARTEEGFVFRTDMRLRPNGASGPLVLSFDAMEHYYQTHGRDWERYALIKARVVGGDRVAGNQLLSSLKPFVYRKYLDFGAFEAIRSMKTLIERQLRKEELQNNLKVGRGGIREVEFITQSYQLIRGGREPKLQTQRLYEALANLVKSRIVDQSQADCLLKAYRFLRNTEHCLQMIDDQQTHVLPTQTDDRNRLALAMGFGTWHVFQNTVSDVMEEVHRQFQDTFLPVERESTDRDEITDLWMGSLNSERQTDTLQGLGYDRPDVTRDLLDELRSGSAYKSLSKSGRDRLDRLMPLALDATAKTHNPSITLTRLINVIQSIGKRSAYLALLVENPQALSQLVKLCSASPWISTWLSQHPILLDELLVPLRSYQSMSVQQLTQELSQQIDAVGADDLEAHMEILREYHHARLLQIAAADAAQDISVWEVSVELCRLAEAVLAQSVIIAKRGLLKRYGTPAWDVDRDQTEPQLGIVAYGKLGSFELGYHSDLDIVLLYEARPPGAADRSAHGEEGMTTGGPKSISNGHYFGRLGQRLVHILTTRTAAGLLYEIDMRLRPSGRSGTLVSSIEAFASYQSEHAWTWEHQALVRARLVVGNPRLAKRFEDIRHRILCRHRDQKQLKDAIRTMRQKMIDSNSRSDNTWFDLKIDHGGIVDIEFLVQYYVLQFAARYPELTKPRDNMKLLTLAGQIGIIDSNQARALNEAYRKLLHKENELKLMELPRLIHREELLEARETVHAAWRGVFEGHPC